MDLLQGLNPQQADAVRHVEGPLLILAGAGSGKTRVIVHRMAYLIQQHGVPPKSIFAVTFTNKAAREMRERVQTLVAGDPGGTPVVSTFHSFCVRLLRQDGDPLANIRSGFTRTFNIYDDDDQLSVIKQVYKQLGLDDKFMQHRAALSAISRAKNHKQTPADFYKMSNDPKMSKLAVVFEHYETRLKQANALDFDDLLLESVRLLHHDKDTRDRWNQRIQFLMIDEYQDTNRSQYELMRLLSTSHKNVCVVGDEDQSIYGWRGADIKNILDFEHDYPNAKVIRLEQNYRSTGNILKSAGAVVARNKQRKGKNLWTSASDGDKIGLYEAPDAENEGLWIADTIEKHIKADSKTHVAVLYRTNSQSRQIEEALRRYNRKYAVVGGFSFYQRAEVKDALSYLKVISSPSDSISLLRIVNSPARGIGKTTMEEVEKFGLENELSLWSAIGRMLDENRLSSRAAAAFGAFRQTIETLRELAAESGPEAVIRKMLDATGYWKMLEDDPSPESESRLQNLSELINAAAEATERGENLTEFLDHAALVSDADSVDEQAQVSLLTMHNAKGLEFPVVFVAGLEEGLFPHSRSRDNEDALEEERRLCYVAMTRARQSLYLSYARSRRRFGTGMPEPTIPSRFINEVPTGLLNLENVGVKGRDVDLFGEQHSVRESARRNLFTGKTYNSVENIAQYFAERGVQLPPRADAAPAPRPAMAVPAVPTPAVPKMAAPQRKVVGGIRSGTVIEHPKYGRGTVVRKEGDGDDAKLTVSFPGHGLKKLIQKFAGITVTE